MYVLHTYMYAYMYASHIGLFVCRRDGYDLVIH